MVKQPDVTGNMYLSAAQAILAEAGASIHYKELATRAVDTGLVKTTGKTPWDSMASNLYTHVDKFGADAIFVKAGKGRFGLRVWSSEAAAPDAPVVEPQPPVIALAVDPAHAIATALLASQHASSNAVGFELAIRDAFAWLGFAAQHVGGPGQTDVLLDAPVTGGPYRVIVDAKSNKNGKVSDASIDWNSLSDHRKAVLADHILVVAPGFGGGNLLKRADEYSVVLLTGEELAEVARLHQVTPFSLNDLRPLFETPGRATIALSELRLTAEAHRGRWWLLRQIVELVRELPAGAYPDAQNIWLLLSYQRKESAPTIDDVKDAIAVVASRTVGILKPNNNGVFILTMQVETALRRLQALARHVHDGGSSVSQSVPISQSLSKA